MINTIETGIGLFPIIGIGATIGNIISNIFGIGTAIVKIISNTIGIGIGVKILVLIISGSEPFFV